MAEDVSMVKGHSRTRYKVYKAKVYNYNVLLASNRFKWKIHRMKPHYSAKNRPGLLTPSSASCLANVIGQNLIHVKIHLISTT